MQTLAEISTTVFEAMKFYRHRPKRDTLQCSAIQWSVRSMLRAIHKNYNYFFSFGKTKYLQFNTFIKIIFCFVIEKTFYEYISDILYLWLSLISVQGNDFMIFLYRQVANYESYAKWFHYVWLEMTFIKKLLDVI